MGKTRSGEGINLDADEKENEAEQENQDCVINAWVSDPSPGANAKGHGRSSRG